MTHADCISLSTLDADPSAWFRDGRAFFVAVGDGVEAIACAQDEDRDDSRPAALASAELGLGHRMGDDVSDSNPYVEARREWNDRYLELVRERRWWQIVAGTELALSLILAGGLISVSVEQKTVPYVVEVDSLGAALAIKPAENGGRPVDERIVRYQLAAFIRGARQVMTDRIAMKQGLEQVYAYARGPARAYLDDYYRANNPFEIAKTYVVVPTVTSLLRLSPTSWQVRWTGEQRGLDGLPLGKSQWEGVVTTEVISPTSEETVLVNPLGLYVTDLRWTKQL